MKELLCKSLNGQSVYLDIENTHVGLHIQETPELLQLVKEVITASNVSGDKTVIEKDMGRVVGISSLVETTDDDDIVYAKRIGRDTFMRFTRSQGLLPTKFVSVILMKSEGGYILWSAWCGKLPPTVPEGENEMPQSRIFWQTHALAYDERIIQPKTITSENPWAV